MNQQAVQQVQPRKFVLMEECEWIEKFKPIANHLDENASGFSDENERGCLFETYGAEVQYVCDVSNGKIPGLSELNVWTYLDGDGYPKNCPQAAKLKALGYKYKRDTGWTDQNESSLDESLICDGYHYVNRIGYYITAVPREPDVEYNVVPQEIIDIKVDE